MHCKLWVCNVDWFQKLSPLLLWFLQGIGNGIPIGAVVTTLEIAKVLTSRTYFNTFGGNPACTAGALAVLKVIDKEKLQENAFVVGSYLKECLTSLKEKHESMVLLHFFEMLSQKFFTA